jgi:hypothetical protein
MTSSVVCKYSAAAPTGSSSGSITLQDCNPSISNDETLSSWQVILIVIFIVAIGVAAQWLLHHLNKDALHKLREDFGNLAKPAE